MAFSGTLTLTDLNDFISPAQACIKPVEEVKKTDDQPKTGAKTEIVIDSTGSYYEVSNEPSYGSVDISKGNTRSSSSGQKLEQAQINLNDCLACSGCITSAESVLITLQSHTEVFNFIESNKDACSDTKKLLVLSIAPQSLASLAASLTARFPQALTTPLQVLRRVRAFCKETLGFSEVFDTTFARHLSLREHVLEFEERKKKDSQGGQEAEGQLPMLASACPGWICYAEKAHAGMLPFISRTKSPQQVMGTLVKEWMAQKWNKKPDGIYHVSVMPCYDKKLEASRQDFYNDVYSTRDVDCVITTGELELMMKEKDWDISKSVPHELDEQQTSPSDAIHLPELIQHPGSSSGSYLQSIIDHVTETSPVTLALNTKLMRNADYEEFTLAEEASGKIVFKGAKCYGFRNLQNIVRKVGRDKGVRLGGGAAGKLGGKATGGVGRRIARRKGADAAAGGGSGEASAANRQYDYVEVMACPSGCVNGGGQLKPVASTTSSSTDATVPPNTTSNGNVDEEGYVRNWEESGVMQSSAKWGDKDWTKKVEEAYWSSSLLSPSIIAKGQDEMRQVEGGEKNREVAGHGESKGGTSGVRGDAGRYHGEKWDTKSGQNGSAVSEVSEMSGHQVPHDLDSPLSTSSIDIKGGQVTWGDASAQGGDVDHGSIVKTGKHETMVEAGGAIGSPEPGAWSKLPHLSHLIRQRFSLANDLAERIVEEMCRSSEGGDYTEFEGRRHRFFRTQYHAVESEVVGLAVKW
ncbi:nuclear prelamin A recognition factor-like protein [Coprinopsis cinerea okayama7|uniref:Nuclear prelamin A recognition factor-like protein n=1 Tax=Coprinopsis cinerea (strain Okayama-7 / 130 / ATCC MYA-4618 / FGSC 9003) TaxID=240176 RepID=A8N5W4_COPC7|nr:nuclear prelamin A recognition factor-like protein [Coprinopsis cinerea okayama7\|eukprot:XP_001830259.1 nuclear prelamin A recognition factor-like protein [Coprinopsis cinerea okayama7\